MSTRLHCPSHPPLQQPKTCQASAPTLANRVVLRTACPRCPYIMWPSRLSDAYPEGSDESFGGSGMAGLIVDW